MSAGSLLSLGVLVVALMAAVDAFLLAGAPPPGGRTLPAEMARLSAEIRRTLREPLLTGVLLLIMTLCVPLIGQMPFVVLAAGALLVIVMAARQRPPLADPRLRAIRGKLLQLGLLRWAALFLPPAIVPVLVPPLSVLGAVVMWGTLLWARRQLTVVLVPAPPQRAHSVAPLEPALPADPLAELLRGAAACAPLECTGCGAAVPAAEPVCGNCGLLFASRVPAALRPLGAAGYHILRPLGSGGMSTVYLGYDGHAREWCALKTIVAVGQTGDQIWRNQAAQSLAREAAMLASIDHPQVSRRRSWLDDQQRPCLLLDLVAGPSLEQKLAARNGVGMPADQVCAWGVGIAGVLRHLAGQELPIAHGDLKPANLLVSGTPARPTLIDFGSAARMQSAWDALQTHDTYGTPGYAAPEQYRGQIGPASDIYGLGATLYHLMSGDDPSQHPLQFPALAAMPSDTQRLLGAMLDPDPLRRPTAALLHTRLQLRCR